MRRINRKKIEMSDDVASSAMSERLRQAYLALPLSNAAKQRLVNIVYRTAGAAFRGMVHYETWRRVHKAVFAEPQPIADLPVSRLEAETRFEPASNCRSSASSYAHSTATPRACAACIGSRRTHRRLDSK